MANELISQKIKLPVSPENKAKLLESIEDEFKRIGICDVDDDEIKVTKIKSMLSFFDASASVTLKEKGENYTVDAALDYKPSVCFWINVIISVVLTLATCFALIPLPIIDAILFFVGKKKLVESVNNAMNNVAREF